MKFLPICTVLLAFSVAAQEQYQLLWEITGKKLKQPSYLFGSMHSNDTRLFQFPDSLYVAFERAETIVLEADVSELFDKNDVRVDWNSLLILPGQNEASVSPEGTRTVYGDEDGRPHFLDAWFQQTGYCAGKKFVALEKVEDQQKLGATFEQYSERPRLRNLFFSQENFIQSYIRGDLTSLTTMLKAQLEVIPGAYETLITRRNKTMATGLDTLMRKGSVFCAIGSGHLLGNDGVIQLLRAKGYAVRVVNACYSPEGSVAESQVMSYRTFTYTNDSLQFAARFSGKPVVYRSARALRVVFAELGQGNRYEIITEPADRVIEDYVPDFFTGKAVQVHRGHLTDGSEYIEGLTYLPNLGAVWTRIVIRDGQLFRLNACGGNKFMHSGRAKTFFEKQVVFN